MGYISVCITNRDASVEANSIAAMEIFDRMGKIKHEVCSQTNGGSSSLWKLCLEKRTAKAYPLK